MTSEQIKAAFAKIGISDINDVDMIQDKMVSFLFDNTATVFSYPPDELHQLLEIDWDNELFYFREFVKGYCTLQIKPFDSLQQLCAKYDYDFKSISSQKKYDEFEYDEETGEYNNLTTPPKKFIKYPSHGSTIIR